MFCCSNIEFAAQRHMGENKTFVLFEREWCSIVASSRGSVIAHPGLCRAVEEFLDEALVSLLALFRVVHLLHLPPHRLLDR